MTKNTGKQNRFLVYFLHCMNTERTYKNEQVPVYFTMLWSNGNMTKTVCMGKVKIRNSHVIRKTRIVR